MIGIALVALATTLVCASDVVADTEKDHQAIRALFAKEQEGHIHKMCTSELNSPIIQKDELAYQLAVVQSIVHTYKILPRNSYWLDLLNSF